MFENFSLITKKDNKICKPDVTWDTASKIFCACELHTGFGERVIWTESNSIPLIKLIEFYKLLENSVTNSDSRLYDYSFNNDQSIITFSWSRSEPTAVTFKIGRKLHNREDDLIQKTVSTVEVWSYSETFYISAMSLLTLGANTDVCVKVGQLFKAHVGDVLFEFEIGQKVRTVIGQNVKTQREGFVINRFRHNNDNTNMYQLLVNGKKIDKRYLKSDLELI